MDGSARTLGALFVLGVVQSIGPCVLQRAVGLTSLTAAATRPALTIGTFVVGILMAYEAYLFATPFVMVISGNLNVLFAIMAVAMVVGGLWTLRGSEHAHCAPAGQSQGGVFLLGMGTVLQLAPCCSLIALSIVASSAWLGVPRAAEMLLAYGLGHAAPLVALGIGTASLRRFIQVAGAWRGLAYLNASVLVWLGVYFAVQV